MEIKRCSYCVMDTTDPEINFYENGRCNHCCNAEKILQKKPYCLSSEEKKKALQELTSQLKKEGKGKRYDCIIGVSGGVDSTYLAYVTKQKLGLNPLAVHLDNGWNSELAVENIENLLKQLNIDFFSYVIDWDEFKDLQLAFLKASTPDSEIPTDHAIISILYRMAIKENVPYILTGHNWATESIMAGSWSQGYSDWKYIKALHKKFGTKSISTYPYRTFIKDKIYYSIIKKIKRISLLDHMDYNKSEAIKILENELHWQSYGRKHHESIYTRFFQSYILPKKFGFDKRKAHLSSLIVSGQISRREAILQLEQNPYDETTIEEDKEYVAKKFGISVEEFHKIMALPIKRFTDYPSYKHSWYYNIGSKIHHLLKRKAEVV